MQDYMQNQMCVKKWLDYHGLHNFFIEDIQRSILDYFNKLDPCGWVKFFDPGEYEGEWNPLPEDGLIDVCVDEHGVLFVTVIYLLSDLSNKEIPLVVALADGGKTFLHWDFRKGVSKEDREYFMMYLKGGE